MKQVIRLTESDLHQLISESVKNIIAEDMKQEQHRRLNESVDEGLLGMGAGWILSGLVKKVVNLLAGLLHLDRNGVLYRVLTSKLFAMALGNEIENSLKLKKKARANGLNESMDENVLTSLLGNMNQNTLCQLLGINLGGGAGGNKGDLGSVLGGLMGGNGQQGGNTLGNILQTGKNIIGGLMGGQNTAPNTNTTTQNTNNTQPNAGATAPQTAAQNQQAQPNQGWTSSASYGNNTNNQIKYNQNN